MGSLLRYRYNLAFPCKKAKKVYGVEIVPEAIEDAVTNAKLNGIDNAEFYVGKAEEILPENMTKKMYMPMLL